MDAMVVAPDGAAVTIELAQGLSLRAASGDTSARGPVKVVIRPERIGIEPATSSGPNYVSALVQRSVYHGSGTQVSLILANGQTLTALVQNSQAGDDPTWAAGNAVSVHLPDWALRVLPETS
jgi:ABC-type Fe3+/spermidine/putrescine transport system ATPase subunit